MSLLEVSEILAHYFRLSASTEFGSWFPTLELSTETVMLTEVWKEGGWRTMCDKAS